MFCFFHVADRKEGYSVKRDDDYLQRSDFINREIPINRNPLQDDKSSMTGSELRDANTEYVLGETNTGHSLDKKINEPVNRCDPKYCS